MTIDSDSSGSERSDSGGSGAENGDSTNRGRSQPDAALRFARADALFAEALERPEAEREAFVRARTHDDPSLGADVLGLLGAVATAERQIGESALDLLPSGEDVLAGEPPLPVGTRIGAWRVLGEIGRGGMGIVVRAERADGAFERTVAIKLIRDEVSGPAWARRFAAERRMLATLDHPFIARLQDAGTTEDGRPYLVMDAVTGTRIDRHADATSLDIRARLRLVVDVCDAVSHAHQRLIVHRDLKPANILVSDDGVRLLDFGIAALLADRDDVDRDGAEPITRRGQRLLTPEYASPEQVRGAPASVSADVYSLGVILHELLVGDRPAWQRLVLERAETRALDAALTEPSRAFAQVARTERARAAAIAAARGMQPYQLQRAIAGDLDAIVLTALAPDPSRRYATVQALREDIERVLRGEPVQARATSRTERLAKFLRRHRGPALATALLAITTVVYVGTMVAQSRRVVRERDRAERERARATQVATLLTSLFTAADPFEQGRPDTLRAGVFLDRAVERVARDLAGQPDVQSDLYATLGSVYRQLDRLDEAEPLLEQARRLIDSSTVLTTLDAGRVAYELALLRLDQSRFAAADTTARRLLTSLGDTPGDSARALRVRAIVVLGRVQLERGNLDSATAIFDSVLALARAMQPVDSLELARVLNHRGAVAQRRADYAAALRDIQVAWELQKATLGADHPTALTNQANVAFLTDRSGRSADAVPLYRDVIARTTDRLGNRHPNVLMAMVNLGGALGRAGQQEEAIRVTEQAVERHRQRSGGPYLEHAVALDYLSGLYDRAGRRADAIARSTQAVALMAEINGPDHPNTAMIRAMSATLRCRGSESTAAERREAIAEFRRALRALSAALPPAHPRLLSRRAALGSCLAADQQLPAAEAELTAAFAIMAADAALARDRVARFVGEELLRFYERTRQPTKRARIEALLDSLARIAPA